MANGGVGRNWKQNWFASLAFPAFLQDPVARGPGLSIRAEHFLSYSRGSMGNRGFYRRSATPRTNQLCRALPQSDLIRRRALVKGQIVLSLKMIGQHRRIVCMFIRRRAGEVREDGRDVRYGEWILAGKQASDDDHRGACGKPYNPKCYYLGFTLSKPYPRELTIRPMLGIFKVQTIGGLSI